MKDFLYCLIVLLLLTAIGTVVFTSYDRYKKETASANITDTELKEAIVSNREYAKIILKLAKDSKKYDNIKDAAQEIINLCERKDLDDRTKLQYMKDEAERASRRIEAPDKIKDYFELIKNQS